MIGAVDAVDPPIMLRVTPAHMMGRVSAVFSPLVQLSNIAAMAIAGVLASTALRGFHAVIAGIAFGPYDTIFGLAGLLFILAGLATIGPMRGLPAAASGDDGEDAALATGEMTSAPSS